MHVQWAYATIAEVIYLPIHTIHYADENDTEFTSITKRQKVSS